MKYLAVSEYTMQAMCDGCGSVVANTEAHDAWHGRMDELIKVTRSMARLSAGPEGTAAGALPSARDFERTTAFGAEGGS